VRPRQEAERLAAELKRLTGCKAKGDREAYIRLLASFVKKGESKLFVPWAAPVVSRNDFSMEARTLDYLFNENGVLAAFGKIGRVTVRLLKADEYSRRNGINESIYLPYWDTVEQMAGNRAAALSACQKSDTGKGIKCKNENDERVDTSSSSTAAKPNDNNRNKYKVETLLASATFSQLYQNGLVSAAMPVFDSLDKRVQKKIIQSAAKYTGGDEATALRSAQEYTALRAAEARWVAAQGLLWLSLNFQERDLMAAGVPRIYVPEQYRTPWLKYNQALERNV